MHEVIQALHLCCVCRPVTRQPVQGPLCADDGHHCWPLPWGVSRMGWALCCFTGSFERLIEGRLQWHISHPPERLRLLREGLGNPEGSDILG